MRITVRTAGGSDCRLTPCQQWTCHDLKAQIHKTLGISVAQQRLIHGCKILEDFMATAAIGTVGELLQMEGGPEMSLELTLYIRSAAVAEAIEAIRQEGWTLGLASEELRADREVVMEAVKQKCRALFGSLPRS